MASHDAERAVYLAQVFHTFNARSQSRSAFTSRLLTNGWLWLAVGVCFTLQVAAVYVPLLQKVLRMVSPTVSDWGVIAGLLAVACGSGRNSQGDPARRGSKTLRRL
jgi:magnesium-transporting ATPase (P-type)